MRFKICFLLAALALASGCSTAPRGQAVPGATGAAPAPLATASADLAPLAATVSIERYAVGGFPRSTSPALTLENIGYAVGFSESLMEPLWSAYYCGPTPTFENGPRPTRFGVDERVPKASRLNHDDYDRPPGNPTYDRGHMSPNYAIATRYGRQAQIETFLMTNIVPQRSSLNQKTWKALEAEIARNFAPACKGVWVIVGPIFKGPLTRYNGKAAMPSGFYCIVLDRADNGSLRALALTMDQSVTGKRRLGDFVTSIRAIEGDTGLDFFAGLADAVEDRLEKSKADAAWDLELILDPDKYND